MRITLAKLLAQAVKDIAEFRSTTIDQHNFMNWVDRYQAQLVVLASQIRFVPVSYHWIAADVANIEKYEKKRLNCMSAETVVVFEAVLM
jgi:hypothetical protein